ncbi:MAG TPA: CpaF family protein [Candidatus Binatus sp.]|nr:CpaF family protein [Candidatus Binatus sp.]
MSSPTATTGPFQELKLRVHRDLLERLDMGALASLDSAHAEDQVRHALRRLLKANELELSAAEREKLIEEVGHEVVGLGPLDPLLKDGDISDILVNGPSAVYVERHGRLSLTDVKFRDEQHLLHVIERIVAAVGRRVDERSPIVDARLPDGSRVNAIIAPLALHGPCLSIRRFGHSALRMDDLVTLRSLVPQMVGYLAAVSRGRLNIVISGGAGAGKTTLLNCISSFIPVYERIVTIEDSAELQLQQPHIVPLETRPPDLDGHGEITQRDLVRNAPRMRPDRIIVGEVRGAEAFDMLQAMNTGHDGSLTTVHANSPRECLQRLEVMVLMAGYDLPLRAVRQQVATALHVLIQAARLPDGSRKVVKISELVGMEGEQLQLQDIFEFVQTGVTAEGAVQGYFRATGLRSRFFDRLVAAGVQPRDVVFEPGAL